MDLLVDIYCLADKYLITEMKFKVGQYLLEHLDILQDIDDLSDDKDKDLETAVHKANLIAESVRKVYASTSSSAWHLCEPLIRQFLDDRDTLVRYPTLQSGQFKVYRKLLCEVPEFATGIALSDLSQYMDCKNCRVQCWTCPECKRTKQRLWICKCGEKERCFDEECMQRRQERLICSHCYRFGTMDLPCRVDKHAQQW